jgi:hypothetical protein
VTDPILIEPDWPHRPAFAVWGLAQDPPIQTATATGWLVPVELYASVPAELLDGAYVDGFRLGQTWVQDTPFTEPEPETASSVPPRGEEIPVEAAPVTVPARKPRRPRRKAVTE